MAASLVAFAFCLGGTCGLAQEGQQPENRLRSSDTALVSPYQQPSASNKTTRPNGPQALVTPIPPGRPITAGPTTHGSSNPGRVTSVKEAPTTSTGWAVIETNLPGASSQTKLTEVSGPTLQPEPILPVRFQQQDRQTFEESVDYQVQLTPPGPLRIFGRLDTEKSLQERIRQEARERPLPERIVFPEEPSVTGGAPVYRPFPPATLLVEPQYVCYSRLGFQQINMERYGWDLGFVTPFVSAGKFYWDVATWPMHAFTQPLRWCDCSSGYCLPGDPVPLMLYPPNWSLSGSAAEVAVVVALVAIFP